MVRLALLLALLARRGSGEECLLPVHKAAEQGDAATLATLLAADRYLADAEDKCDTKIRPIILAANSGSYASVRVLLEAGASPSVAHDGNGVTPLIAAAVAGSAEIVQLLLSHKARVDQAEVRNWTALWCASAKRHLQ